MGDAIGDLGHVGFEEIFNLVQVADAGDDVKALPAAVMLAQQSLADGDRVKLGHIGSDRQPIHRRRGDDRQIAHAGQRQLQGARDGGGGQGQHMDFRAHFLQPLFMADAKVLLFVDHHQAQPFEADALGQKRMGAHHDIDAAIGQTRPRGVGLFGAHKARKGFDRDVKAPEPFNKAAVMLACKQGGGANHRHLLPRKGRHKGRAHRDLGFAKADIADNQAVHRRAFFQIGHDIGDGRKLVVSFGIGESGGKGFPDRMGSFQNGGVAQGAFGGNPHQTVGNFADAIFELGLFGLPRAAAQTV